MGKKASFTLEDPNGNVQNDDSGLEIECTAFRNVFVLILSIGIIVGVGLLSFYLPERDYCEPKEIIPTTSGAIQEDSSTNPLTSTKKSTTNPVTLTTEMPWDGRLPYSIWPLRYELFLTPYLYDEDVGPGQRRFTFDGEVNIRVRCQHYNSTYREHHGKYGESSAAGRGHR